MGSTTHDVGQCEAQTWPMIVKEHWHTARGMEALGRDNRNALVFSGCLDGGTNDEVERVSVRRRGV